MSSRYEIVMSAVDRGVKAAFRGVKEGATRGGQAVAAFNKKMGNGNKAASMLTGQLKALFSAYAAIATVRGLKDAALSAQGLSVGFTSITGSAQGAAKELAFLRGVSKDLRLDFYGLADSYKGILASGKEADISMEDIRGVFVGVSEAGTALQLSNEDLKGSLIALSQMMSKGKVSAEELRQQLGERLPGAFPLAAKAMGVTTAELDKMMSTGNLAATDFIPKFAEALKQKYGGAARAAAGDTSNMQAAINDFSTAWMDLKVAIAESGFIEKATGLLRQLSDLFQDPGFKKSITDVASAIFTIVGALAQFTLKHIKAVSVLAGSAGLIWAFKKLKNLIEGTSAALEVLTGVNLVGWLSKAAAGFRALTVAIASSAAAIGALYVAATLGLVAIIADLVLLYQGWKNNREAAERLAKTVNEIKENYSGLRDLKAPDNLFDLGQEKLASLHDDLLKTRAYYIAMVSELEFKSKQRTFFGNLTDEAKAAQKELVGARARLDEVRNDISRIENMTGFEQPKKEIMATNDQLEQFKKTAKDAYDSAEAEAKKYADKISELNNNIADRDLSLQDKIRELKRQNMTEDQAAADVRLEALEKERAAEEALAKFKQSGSERDLEMLKKFASDAESAWDKYANQGEAATNQSISGLTRINDLLDEADNTQIDTFSEMRDDAEKAMGDIEAMVRHINESTQFNIPIRLKDLQSAQRQINDLVKDETKHITIDVTEKHGHGGRVGMARGGRFPGNSKIDSIPVLARPGEGFVRNEALSVWDRAFGRGFFEGINNPMGAAGQAIMAALQGKISLPSMPKTAPKMAFATGGRATGYGGQDMGTVNLTLDGNSFPMMGRVDDIGRLKQYIRRENARRSNL